MPTPSNKHVNAQQKFYPAFDGGLNLSVPAESMNPNELKEALNVEFSNLTGSMRVRGGLVWSARFEREVDSIVPVRGRRGFLARIKGTRKLYYFKWNNIWDVSGELTGDEDLSAAAWDEAGELVIASGGKLQKFSDSVIPQLTTLENSPDECRIVFVREGRVGVVSGADTIYFSWVGDCELWDNDPDDESTGQFIEVGYKDGMDINAVIPLSRDLIIFKSPTNETDKGTIWRLTGEFPDWSLLEAAHNTGTFSMRSVKAVANDVFYITTAGVATLSSVTSYGEIKASWPDRKVNSALVPLIDDTAQLWDVPVKQQVWALPSKNEDIIWVLDCARGIWTKFQFPKVPFYATGIDEKLYIIIGRNIYNVNDYYTQDEIKDEAKTAIKARMKLGAILTARQTLIKGAFASFEIFPECDAVLNLSKFQMPFRAGGTIDYIYDPPNDTQYASEDDDALFPEGNVLTSRRRCIVREWAVAPEVIINGGGCSLSTIGLEIAEV